MAKQLTLEVRITAEAPGRMAAALVGCGGILATVTPETGTMDEARSRCADLATALRAAADAYDALVVR